MSKKIKSFIDLRLEITTRMMKDKVMQLFRTRTDNTLKSIADETGFEYNFVNKCLDDNLNKRKKNYGFKLE